MKSLPFLRLRACAAVVLGVVALPLGVSAQDLTPPIVKKPLANVTVPAGTTVSVVKLNGTFGLQGVTGTTVRFFTNTGNIDVELFDAKTPKTVSAFLKYVNTLSANSSGNYTYNDTLIQRAVPNFIVQGGGFYVGTDKRVTQITGRPAIPGEAGIPNTRGTIAMALSNGPDSATGDWFFNVVSNTILDDTSDGGPFTVFGRVLSTMSTVDAIEALPQRDFSSSLGQGFENVPLVNFDGKNATVDNLVKLNKIAGVSLLPSAANNDGLLTIKIKNSNPDLLTVKFKGKKFKLLYKAGQTGTARIKVYATDTAGTRVKGKFTVTVR